MIAVSELMDDYPKPYFAIDQTSMLKNFLDKSQIIYI